MQSGQRLLRTGQGASLRRSSVGQAILFHIRVWVMIFMFLSYYIYHVSPMPCLIFTFLHRRELTPWRWSGVGLVAGLVIRNNIFSPSLYWFLMTKGEKRGLKLLHLVYPCLSLLHRSDRCRALVWPMPVGWREQPIIILHLYLLGLENICVSATVCLNLYCNN
jgi:hypothetical protein